ncbi:hypothetical protein BC830DRAFT_352037, partial [Chytriomyces sp. MP71]
MVSVILPAEYGYVVLLVVAFYLQQNILFVIPVVQQRFSTKINAPTLYPRDSEIKELKLSTAQVRKYMFAQRVHQNNVELMSFFLPAFLIAGLANPIHTAIAGSYVFVMRLLYAFANPDGKIRGVSGTYHLAECYVLFLAGSFG